MSKKELLIIFLLSIFLALVTLFLPLLLWSAPSVVVTIFTIPWVLGSILPTAFCMLVEDWFYWPPLPPTGFYATCHNLSFFLLSFLFWFVILAVGWWVVIKWIRRCDRMNSQDSGQKFLFKLLLSVLLYALLVPLGILTGGALFVYRVLGEPFFFILVWPLQALLVLLLLFIHLIFAFRISVEYFSPENRAKAWMVIAIVFFVDILVAIFLLNWSGWLGRVFGFEW